MSPPPIIIIAEPDPMISGALRVEFSRWDFAVLLATTCEEAGTFATQTDASLIVLDGAKTLYRAYAACVRIRRHPGYATRPIVLTVTEDSPRTRAAAITAGATALLPKPYSVMDLFQAAKPHMNADDPLLSAGLTKSGVRSAPMQVWRTGPSLEWQSGQDSALSRNKLLLPIVRGAGKSIPMKGRVT